MQKPTRRLVKKTVIPVSLIDNPSEVCGLIHFPTEQNPKNITPNETTVSRKIHTISYKRESLNEDNEEEVYKKREIEYFDIALAPRRTKEKHFRIDVPVTKGLKSARNFTRLSELFFSFSFNNSEGRLVFLNGIQEAKMEVVRKHNVSSEERVRSQMAMMDNRRKEAINEDVYELESDD